MLISRTGSYLDVLSWFLLAGLVWGGGWLIAASYFNLRARERIVAGAAIGMLLFMFSSNFLLRWLPPSAGFWISGLVILGAGISGACLPGVYLHGRYPASRWQPEEDLRAWPVVALFIAWSVYFTLVNLGLAILDDYANLPLTAMIAAGDAPPHFYLNPDIRLYYHYGLHFFAASLVRVGGLFPWIAFDISKAISAALCLTLAWSWYRRSIGHAAGLVTGVLLILFAGGTRWLLLFLPMQMIQNLGDGLQMLGTAYQTGADLYSALINAWQIEGGGPIPFPFAFVNGIFSPLFGLGSNGALTQMSLFLLLLLARRDWKPGAGLLLGVVVASLSLVNELLFVIVWGGALAAVLLRSWLDRHQRQESSLSRLSLRGWVWVLAPSAILASISGSALTELLQRLFEALVGLPGGNSAVPPVGGVALPAITGYWPPAFISAHFGSLSLFNPRQIVVALFEMGPALLLAPWVTCKGISYLRAGKLFPAGLSWMALASFIVTLFIRFADRERDLARITGTSLFIWLVLAYPYLWHSIERGKGRLKYLVAAGLAITMIGGMALFPPQFVAIASPQASYFIQDVDVQMSRLYWDQLDPDAQVLDLAFPYRPPVLFGRYAGRAYQSVYIPLLEFRRLIANPDARKIADAGFTHVYFDRKTWNNLPVELKQSFQQPCVKMIEEFRSPMGDFRRLIELRQCQAP